MNFILANDIKNFEFYLLKKLIKKDNFYKSWFTAIQHCKTDNLQNNFLKQLVGLGFRVNPLTEAYCIFNTDL